MNSSSLMQKVAEVAPDKYNFLLKTSSEVRESPFRDEILEQLSFIMKKANSGLTPPPGMGSRLGNAAAGIGAAVATGIAFSLAGDMFDAAKRGITKSRNYRSMLKENPDLKELPAEHVQKAFSALHRFNPEFAGDPTVAGSFVRRQAQLGEFDAQQLTNLVGARKNLTDIKKLPIPGKMPWESHEEQALRNAQIGHFQGSGAKSQAEIAKAQQETQQSRELHPHRLRKAMTDANQGADPETLAQFGMRSPRPKR